MIKITHHFILILRLSLFIVISQQHLYSQYYFIRELATPVVQDGKNLTMPWVGGLNGSQFSQMDLNQNGQLDLIVYDRSTRLVHCFTNNNGRYQYAPQYNNIFPNQINAFLQLADFNQDGKLDLFTAGNLGIIAYENISTGSNFRWQKVNDFLTYTSNGGNEVNLQVNVNDYPHIADIDEDGDIDFLNFNSNGLNSRIIYYENRSVDLTGNADLDLLFEANSNWAGIEECDCGDFALNGADCNPNLSGRHALHAGGKSIFTADLNNDAVLELITSHQECRDLFSFFGAQSGTSPTYNTYNSTLLNNPETPQKVLYPNTMPLLDSNKEISHLLISPNLSAQIGVAADYKESNWLYQLNENNEPILTTKSFLQEDMIDWGILTSPAFWDYDNDGDLDLFLSFTNTDSTLNIYSGIALYENIGDGSNPSFRLIEEDFLSFSTTELSNLLIQLVDINQDGQQDLAYQATENGQNNLWIRYGNTGASFDAPIKIDDVFIGFGYSFHFTPILGNNNYDLLIGKSSGGLILYENNSTSVNPSFQAVNNSYLSIGDDFFKSSLKVSTVDIDNDSQTDLILSDLSGVYKIYPNFLNETEQYDSVALIDQETYFGQANILTSANLFDSEFPSIISGNLSGGLTILRNKIEFDQNTGVNTERLKLYPNPSNGRFKVNTSASGTLSVITLSGKVLYSGIIIKAGINELDLSALSQGLYIVSVSFYDGGFASQKIVVK